MRKIVFSIMAAFALLTIIDYPPSWAEEPPLEKPNITTDPCIKCGTNTDPKSHTSCPCGNGNLCDDGHEECACGGGKVCDKENHGDCACGGGKVCDKENHGPAPCQKEGHRKCDGKKHEPGWCGTPGHYKCEGLHSSPCTCGKDHACCKCPIKSNLCIKCNQSTVNMGGAAGCKCTCAKCSRGVVSGHALAFYCDNKKWYLCGSCTPCGCVVCDPNPDPDPPEEGDDNPSHEHTWESGAPTITTGSVNATVGSDTPIYVLLDEETNLGESSDGCFGGSIFNLQIQNGTITYPKSCSCGATGTPESHPFLYTEQAGHQYDSWTETWVSNTDDGVKSKFTSVGPTAASCTITLAPLDSEYENNSEYFISKAINKKIQVYDFFLRGDNNNDGVINETDDNETGVAVLPANEGDKNGNDIPDYADLEDLGAEVFSKMHFCAAGLTNSTNHKVSFRYPLAELVSKVNGGYPEPKGGHLRLWKKSSRESREISDLIVPEELDQNGEIINGLYSLDQFTFDEKGICTLYVEWVEGSAPSPDPRIDIELHYTGQATPGVYHLGKKTHDWVDYVDIRAHIVPDWNRDGTIDSNDENKVTSVKPWRWWVNDDDDRDSDKSTGLTNDPILGAVPDDLPGQSDKDCNSTNVNGVRDLIDFCPLKLNIGLAISKLPISDYDYHLKSTVPINIFYGCESDGNQSLAKAADIYTDYATSIRFKDRAVVEIKNDLKQIDENFLTNCTNKLIYFEGKEVKDGELSLIITKKGETHELVEVKFPLETSSVTDMYRQKSVRGDMGDTDKGVDQFSDLSVDIPKIPLNMAFDVQDNKVDKTLIWVHGYNVTGEAAAATFAEVFKRLYHQGFKGEFIGFTWFGNPSGIPAPHYHQTVVNGFYASKLLADYIKTVSGRRYLTGHSMGGMVVSNAIQNYLDLRDYEKFFALDAAAALECYGQVTVDESMVNIEGDIIGNLNDFEWFDCWTNNKDKRLFASEWYKLFPHASDKRKELTWRECLLKPVADGKMINFYSSTEEILRKYDGDNAVWHEGAASGYYGWVKQEKFKGNSDGPSLGGFDSPFCGYSVNNDYSEHWGAFSGKLKTGTKTAITDGDLRRNPFFRLTTYSIFSTYDIAMRELLDKDEILPEVLNLYYQQNSNPPSIIDEIALYEFSNIIRAGRYLSKKISETSLTNYYTENVAVHPHVTVKDFLLAEAFPATTLPMGANPLSAHGFSGGNNIDMSTTCKANVGTPPDYTWPRLEDFNDDGKDDPVWHHSDYKDLPYQFTYPFYKKIVKETK